MNSTRAAKAVISSPRPAADDGYALSMPLRRCFSSLGCPELSLEETCALAVRHRVSRVELRALGGTMDLPAYFAQHYGTPARLAGAASAASVDVVALDASLRMVGGTRDEREQLAALAPWAEALGVRWLRVFDGGAGSDITETGEAAETLRWWRELKEARGWRCDLMIETHDSLFTAEVIRRFVTVNPGTAILWDSHHTWKKGGEDPVTMWRAIRTSVVHVHVKDSISVPSAKHPFTYVLPGRGEFPIAPLLAVLRADGFSGPVSLEWEKVWHPYLPSLDEALTAARNWWGDA